MKLAVRRAHASEADALEMFRSESEPGDGAVTAPRRRSGRVWVLSSLAMCVAALGAGGAYATRRVEAARIAPATVVIDARPSGADVLVNGKPRGRTPLTLQLPPGEYSGEVVLGTQRIPLRISAAAGATIAHHVEFSAPVAAPAPVAEASLRVATEPARMNVFVDGVGHGSSPVRIAGLASGTHKVRVVSPAGATERTVSLNAGEDLSLVLAAAGLDGKPPGGGGFVAISSPVPLRLLEGSQLIGTSDVSRIMLPAGSHDLDLVNDDLGYREHRTVAIAPGKASTLTINVPHAPVNINAVPWADVWIDNEHVGQTPIGNYSVPIGTHQVTFRHPDLGERRQQIVVGLKSPNRVSVDLNRK